MGKTLGLIVLALALGLAVYFGYQYKASGVRLVADTLRLFTRSLLAENALYKEREGRSKERAVSAQDSTRLAVSLRGALSRADRAVDAMNAKEKKQAADRGVERTKVAPRLPTTDADSVVNLIVAKYDGKLKVYEDSIPKLHSTIGRLTGENQALRDERSELEIELNHVNNAHADALDKLVDNKRPLNIGLGKQTRRLASEMRAGRVKR